MLVIYKQSSVQEPIHRVPQGRASKCKIMSENWFSVNFTVIFCSLGDNPVIQYFQLEYERHRAV